MRSRTLAVLVAVAAVPILGSAARAAEAPPPGLGVRLLEAPRDLADDPRAQVYVIDHVIPGAVVERRLEVANGDDAPMEVELYGAAADVAGGWVVGDGRGGNELAGWVDVEPPTLTLAPGERREVAATIRVPADAGGGERYAAIVAETQGPGRGGVRLVNRAGIRVYLSVGSGPAPAAAFVIDSLTAGRSPDGDPYLLIRVTNTGERAIDATGEAELDDGPGGLRAGPFPVSLPRTVAPGGTAELRVPLSRDVPAGPWLARARLRSGLVEAEAEAVVTFPADGEVGEAVAARPVTPAGGPLLPAVLLSMAAIAALLFVLLARRRSRDDEDDPDGSDGRWAGVPESAG